MALEPIRWRNLAEEDRAEVQRRVVEAVQKDPDRFIAAYRQLSQSFGGRYVCADLFKETFPEYSASKEARNRYNAAVHNSAAVLAAEQFRRAIDDRSDPTRDEALFLTGIPGAGKTSTVLAVGNLSERHRVVYEGQLSDPAGASEKLDQALRAGLKPTIMVVHRSPEQALENTLYRYAAVGRGAGIGVMADIQGNLPGSLRQLEGQFRSSVGLMVFDGPIDRQVRLNGWRAISVLDREGSRDEIYRRLEKHLDRLKEAGRIGEDAWRQARGVFASRDLDLGGQGGRGRQPDGAGSGTPKKRREEELLALSPAHKELADLFRRSTQAERLANPALNSAAKALANANGVIDSAFGRDSKMAIELRAAVSERIALKLAQGVNFETPKTLQKTRVTDATIVRSDRLRDR